MVKVFDKLNSLPEVSHVLEIYNTYLVSLKRGDLLRVEVKNDNIIFPYAFNDAFTIIEYPLDKLDSLTFDDSLQQYVKKTIIRFPKNRVAKIRHHSDAISVEFINGFRAELNEKEINFTEKDLEWYSDPKNVVSLHTRLNEIDVEFRTNVDETKNIRVEQILKKIIEANANGPFVRVYNDRIETPYGMIIIPKINNLHLTDEEKKAVLAMLGNHKYAQYLDEIRHDNISIIPMETNVGKLYKILGHTVWKDKYYYYIGKISFTAFPTYGEKIPLHHPILRSGVEKIKNGEKPLPYEVFPGLGDGEEYTITVNMKKAVNNIQVTCKRKDGTYTKKFNTYFKFYRRGIIYETVPYLEGVATIYVPWGTREPVLCREHVPENTKIFQSVFFPVKNVKPYKIEGQGNYMEVQLQNISYTIYRDTITVKTKQFEKEILSPPVIDGEETLELFAFVY